MSRHSLIKPEKPKNPKNPPKTPTPKQDTDKPTIMQTSTKFVTEFIAIENSYIVLRRTGAARIKQHDSQSLYLCATTCEIYINFLWDLIGD